MPILKHGMLITTERNDCKKIIISINRPDNNILVTELIFWSPKEISEDDIVQIYECVSVMPNGRKRVDSGYKMIWEREREMTTEEIEAEYGYPIKISDPRWVLCKERLPEKWQKVLIVAESDERDGEVLSAIYKPRNQDGRTRGCFEAKFIGCINNVTHWMPEPVLPKKSI